MKNADRMDVLREWVKDTGKDMNHLDSELVDFVSNQFGFQTITQPYGANGCPAFNRLLRWGYKNGYLKRFRCNIPGMRGLGFPSWVYTYEFI